MRRSMLIIIGGLMLSGCSASQRHDSQMTDCHRHYLAAPASALAFDPQIGVAAPELARDDRGIRAFGGFQGESAEFYDIQTNDDQQFLNYPTNYERQVTSDKVGVIYR